MFGNNMERLKPNNLFFTDFFSAAYYYRLSDEDKDKGDRFKESRSITTQRDMISYVVDQGIVKGVKFYKEYFDDDYTGMNFERPAFKEMMRDLEERKIDCIIVKDFSRFGRDSARVKRFLEVDFERKGREVRFIALGDSYDSLYKTPDMGVRMLLCMNEEYSQNQHTKVTLAIRTKQAKGEFIGAFARYGYRKDPDDKHHLVPDPLAFEVVKRIFHLAYYENRGAAQIAGLLTEEGIDPPSVYKEKQGSNYRCGKRIGTVKAWNPDTVHAILKDEVYTGAVVQGKRRKETLLGAPKTVSQEEYVVVPGMHEPAVSREIFDRLQKRRRSPGCRVTRHKSIFHGILKCGDCGHGMTKRTEAGRGKTYISYCCRVHKRQSWQCYPNNISENLLREILIDDFNRAAATLDDLERVVGRYRDAGPAGEWKRELLLEIGEKRRRILEAGRLLDAVQRKWLLDEMDDLTHEELTRRYKEEGEELNRQLGVLERSLNKSGDFASNPWARELLKEGGISELTRELLTELVDAIYVYHDQVIEIVYKFSEELDDLFVTDTDSISGRSG